MKGTALYICVELKRNGVGNLAHIFEDQGYRVINSFLHLKAESKKGPWVIPDQLPESVLLLTNFTEHGGCSKSGARRATVHCNTKGNPLQAYYLPKKPALLGKHAHFSTIYTDFISIVVNNESFVVILNTRIQQGRRVSIRENVLLRGMTFEGLPEDYSYLEKAFLAAIEKSNCISCTHSHYANFSAVSVNN